MRQNVRIRKRQATSASQTLAGAVATAYAGAVGASAGAPPVTGDNADRINAILDGREPHFSYSTPADPTITSEATVTPATVSASLGVSGRRIILSAGTYGTLRITGNDIEMVINSGVTIGTLQLQGVRVRIQAAAGAARDHTINNIGMYPFDAGTTNRTDYMFDGLNVVSGAGTQGSHQNQINALRFAILNCYFDSVGFGLWIADFGGASTDVIIGNSYFNQNRIASDQSTTQATIRSSTGWQRFLLFSSRLRNDNGSGGGRQHLRLHSNNAASEHAWIDDVDFVGTNGQIRPTTTPDGSGGVPASMTNIVFNNTRWYPYNSPSQSIPITGTGSSVDPYPTNVTIQNTTIYTDAFNPFSNPGGAGWTLTNNQTLAAVTPPAWEF